MRFYIKPVHNPSVTLQYACIAYFRDPDLFIGFMGIAEKEETPRDKGVHVYLGGNLEELFRCIADKVRFHLDFSYSVIANCLIRRYLFLRKVAL